MTREQKIECLQYFLFCRNRREILVQYTPDPNLARDILQVFDVDILYFKKPLRKAVERLYDNLCTLWVTHEPVSDSV